MKNQMPSLAADERATARIGNVARLREDWRTARSAHAELVRLGIPRTNVLVTGSDEVVENLLDMLLPDVREPVGRWRPGEQLLLPPPVLIGTMIFQDVGEMPYADQRELLSWLTTATGRTQVLSTTTESLLPAVERGDFIESLYYRLNIISVDATS
jgi:hypothetical protein